MWWPRPFLAVNWPDMSENDDNDAASEPLLSPEEPPPFYVMHGTPPAPISLILNWQVLLGKN